MSGTLKCLRSGLESSQSKMELVVSIETPTTWVQLRYQTQIREGRKVIKI